MPYIASPNRKLPNIAFTGTPATGKSTLARHLARRIPGLNIFEVNAVAEKLGCRGEYDKTLQCYEVDEYKFAEKVLESSLLENGGNIIDWMHADFWMPEEDDVEDDFRPILDLVITVCASNTTLFDRYKEREYPSTKIQDNLDAEIMGVIAEDNETVFAKVEGVDIMQLQNNDKDDMQQNVQKLVEWVRLWRKQHDVSPTPVNDGDETVEDDGEKEKE